MIYVKCNLLLYDMSHVGGGERVSTYFVLKFRTIWPVCGEGKALKKSSKLPTGLLLLRLAPEREYCRFSGNRQNNNNIYATKSFCTFIMYIVNKLNKDINDECTSYLCA